MEPLYPLFSDRSLQQKIKVEEQDLAFQSQKNHKEHNRQISVRNSFE